MNKANWVAISGSRIVDAQVEHDVRTAVAEIYAEGCGLVVGGAPGVDFIATDEVLRHDPAAERLQVVIPTPLGVYRDQYELRIAAGKATRQETKALFGQLETVQALRQAALVCLGHSALTAETFHDRNGEILKRAGRLVAFQVNNSPGTQNTVSTARRLGLAVTLMQYQFRG